MPTAIAYLRVSTDDQALGPEAQRLTIESWAHRESFDVASWHVDRGVSGAAPLDRRPALLEALGELREAGASVLVVAKRDRLARDVVVAATIERAAARAGATVVSADGVGVGDGPEAELLRRIIDAVAAYERGIIRGRTRAALEAKRRRGERTGGVPFGYRLGPDGLRLEIDPGEQGTIERIEALRAGGLAYRAIAERLTAEGVPARGARWHATTVARTWPAAAPRLQRRRWRWGRNLPRGRLEPVVASTDGSLPDESDGSRHRREGTASARHCLGQEADALQGLIQVCNAVLAKARREPGYPRGRLETPEAQRAWEARADLDKRFPGLLPD